MVFYDETSKSLYDDPRCYFDQVVFVIFGYRQLSSLILCRKLLASPIQDKSLMRWMFGPAEEQRELELGMIVVDMINCRDERRYWSTS